MDVSTLVMLLHTCAPSVHPQTARALVSVESSLNPYAIGVVGGSLERQPRTKGEAIATAKMLLRDGWNFSVGLGQINIKNFNRTGLTLNSAFDACPNLRAMSSILGECYARAGHHTSDRQRAVRLAFSCYYSGNFQTGFDAGYVARVVNAAIR